MIRILHTNDFHGKLDAAKFKRLAALREDADLYFDCGDSIRTGNLGVPLGQDPVWAQLAELKCTASVPGNRESHVLRSTFQAKLDGACHPILCANLRERSGKRPLPGSLCFQVGTLRIGIVGVMVAMVTERMKTQGLSAFLWDEPVACAKAEGLALRSNVDLLIALTHIGLRMDRKLAEAEIYDLILGGHSHDVVNPPERAGRTWIAQAGSHGRFAGRYDWEPGVGIVRSELVPLKSH